MSDNGNARLSPARDFSLSMSQDTVTVRNYVLISAVAKKILSRSDLAQLILHQHYELHTGLIFVTQNEIRKSGLIG